MLFCHYFSDTETFEACFHRSTAHVIIALLHSWMSCLDGGGSVRTVLVGFHKAFDLVNYNLLFDKLHNMYGIPNCILKWIGSYLSNRQRRVRANQITSSWNFSWKQLDGDIP